MDSTHNTIVNKLFATMKNPASLLILLLSGNILTMLIMNMFVLGTQWLVFVYLMSLGITFVILAQLEPLPKVSHQWSLSSKEKYVMFAIFLGFFFAYTLSRTYYLLESHLGYTLSTYGDDSHHIQELNSMINTPQYPPVSSFVQDKYFSFYYSPWMFMAFLYYALPFSFITIKAAYSIGHTVYVCLTLLVLFQIAVSVCQTKRHYYLFLGVILLYSGAESLLFFISPLTHHEWWMNKFFGIRLQVSSFSTLNLWVMHHLLGGVAIVLAFMVYRRHREHANNKIRNSAILICGLLLAGSFYSSVFTFIGGIPFMLFLIIQDKLRFRLLVPGFIVATLLVAPVLWMYLGKDTGFMFLPHISSVSQKFQFLITSSRPVVVIFNFMLFLLLISGEMLLYLVAIAVNARELLKNHIDTALVTICLGYTFLLFFIGYSGANNFAMRGMIIPVFVLAYICSKYLQKHACSGWLIALLLILSLGSLNEILRFNKYAYVLTSHKPGDVEVRRVIHTQYNTVRTSKFVHAEQMNIPREEIQKHLCIIEKIVVDHQKPLSSAEIELLSDGPFGLWEYQDWLKNHPINKQVTPPIAVPMQ
jgi:hypothetical protein